MAISLATVRAANAALSFQPGLVAVIVGGTAGIGESTLRSLARDVKNARIYMIGRSEEAATKIKSEVAAQIEFIKADVSLVSDVDRVCDIIKQKEKTLNLLFISSGLASLAGRTDQKLALHYYSRMRFVFNLLPQLRAAGDAEPPQLARVVTVLAAGQEKRLNLDDLDLKHTFSLGNAGTHAITMNSMMVQSFAQKEPSISFIHTYPGLVKTSLGKNGGMLMQTVAKTAYFLLSPFSVDIRECGDRNLYAATSPTFPPAKHATAESDVAVAVGSEGQVGSGAYLLGCDGKPQTQKAAFMKEQQEAGVPQKVWDHTLAMFEAAGKTAKGDESNL